jgi:plasmid stabilization system protein ParE
MVNAREAARSLPMFPRRGRMVPEVGDDSVREVFLKGYRLIYEIQSERIVVIAFLHGARRFPIDLR